MYAVKYVDNGLVQYLGPSRGRTSDLQQARTFRRTCDAKNCHNKSYNVTYNRESKTRECSMEWEVVPVTLTLS